MFHVPSEGVPSKKLVERVEAGYGAFVAASVSVDTATTLNDHRAMVSTLGDPRQAVATANVEPQVLQGIRSLQRHLSAVQTPKVSRIMLYGSYARGDYWEESDVDLAVVFAGEAADAEERMAFDPATVNARSTGS